VRLKIQVVEVDVGSVRVSHVVEGAGSVKAAEMSVRKNPGRKVAVVQLRAVTGAALQGT